jgi:hypothetical protein
MAGPGKWRIGHLAVSLEGEAPTAGYLGSELSHLPSATGAERGHLRVVLGDVPELAGGVHLEEHVVGDTGFVVDRRLIRVGLSAEDASVVRIASKEEPRAAIRDLHNRLRDINYLPAVARVAKDAVYGALIPVVQLSQLPLGQTWLHASVVARGGHAVALAAWGGVGKTSLMLQLVHHHGWRFLADDLAVLDDSGTVHRSPWRIQLYAYSLEGEGALRRRLFAGRGLVDRFQWYALLWKRGPMQVRRRVHAAELFGDAGVADSAKLGQALFLRRIDRDAFSVRNVEPDRAAAAAAATLEFDLDILHRWQLAASGSVSQASLPRPSETSAQSEQVIRSALIESGAECLLVDIPVGARPHELLEYVSSLLDE